MSVRAHQPDYSRLAGNYLIALGALLLIGVNLGGVLLIWFGVRVRQLNNKFHIISIVYLAFNAMIGLVLLALAAWRGPFGSIPIMGNRIMPAPAWALGLFFGSYFLIHLLPIHWLVAPGTREAVRLFKTDPHAHLCPQCHYNLHGNQSGNCPECGLDITPTGANGR